MTAKDDLKALLANLPGAALITERQYDDALSGARVPDGLGVWPGAVGYQDTFDIYWAAISLVGFLAAQPFVKQSSSEGTSVSVEAPSWAGLLAYYRTQSSVAQATARPVLGTIPIPATPHVARVDMSDSDWLGRRGSIGDIDTDLD